MPNVFISYVHSNSAIVDKLVDELRQHSVNVWLDRDKIMPGQRWQDAIRQAIRAGDFFIACFSAEYATHPLSYMNTEIGLAIDMLQQMPEDRIWFIPVLLSACEIPDRSIGGGQTLRDMHWESLYKDWDRSVRRILAAMNIPNRLSRPGSPAHVASSSPPSARGYVNVTLLAPDGSTYAARVDASANYEELLSDLVHQLKLLPEFEYSLSLVDGTTFQEGAILQIREKTGRTHERWETSE